MKTSKEHIVSIITHDDVLNAISDYFENEVGLPEQPENVVRCFEVHAKDRSADGWDVTELTAYVLDVPIEQAFSNYDDDTEDFETHTTEVVN